jgi:hypothetical protein
MNKPGRKTLYTPELADQICEALRNSHKGLNRIAAETPEFPCEQVIYRWRLKYPEFAAKFKDAKRAQIEKIVDQMLERIDCADSKEEVLKMRLWADTVKWLACKLAPAVYGDKSESKITIDGNHDKFVEWAQKQEQADKNK